jgi:anaphase-promoting complex subunit 4
VVRLIGAESSKTVHQFSASDQQSKGISCMGWASNSTAKSSALLSKRGVCSWNEILSEDTPKFPDTTPADLPRDLSLIDIETSLPKLSVLAAGGTS